MLEEGAVFVVRGDDHAAVAEAFPIGGAGEADAHAGRGDGGVGEVVAAFDFGDAGVFDPVGLQRAGADEGGRVIGDEMPAVVAPGPRIRRVRGRKWYPLVVPTRCTVNYERNVEAVRPPAAAK